MKDLLQILARTLQEGRAFCYCRLVETRGSTPQKAGAAMLVFEDGSQAGTLGGGCVEAEVKRRALQLLAEGEAEIARFTLDHDYGWDDGLICGGRMSILLDPCRPAMLASRKEYYQTLTQLGLAGEGLTEVVVFENVDVGRASLAVQNSAAQTAKEGRPTKVIEQDDVGRASLPVPNSEIATAKEGRPTKSLPQVFLFNSANELAAAWNENAITAEISNALTPLSQRPTPHSKNGLAFLPLLPRCPLVIVGAGHVGQAVAHLAEDLDFEVTVVDDRADFLTQSRFPQVKERLAGRIDELLPKLTITPQTYCLIVTRGHNHDQEALYYLADRGARYVGMIGSRRKIRLIFDALRNAGISDEALSHVYAPLGIEIGSQTVPEIAISICAELVSHRNRGGFVPGRPEPILPSEASNLP